MKNISKAINTKTSGTTNHSQSRINPLLLFNISMYTLAAICFMVYTTELTYVHAEGDEDLGSASSSLDASVTVGTACNFSGNVDIPHTSTIMNGVNSADIGKTTMNVTCNDQGGYAVYAIGYTNDEYGNTALQSSISDDYNISTGTSTSGNTSNWSMKLATVSGTTTATIENNYDNYNTVPDDYTKVATLNTITNPGTSTTGSSISTTYQTYISPTQPAGVYTGKVKYTLVHPSTAQKPEVPPPYMQDTATIKQKLVNTGDTMQAIDSRDGKKYWITKLADGNIWMTQNLDLCVGCEDTQLLTSLNTDLNVSGYEPYSSGYTNTDEIITWTPSSYAITDKFIIDNSVSGWQNGSPYPNSAEGGNKYIFTSGNDDKDFVYNSLDECTDAGHPASDCQHYHVGNYYNWSAAIASNYSSAISTDYTVAGNSICPAGWRLPKLKTGLPNTPTNSEINHLFYDSGITASLVRRPLYTENGFNNLRTDPLYYVRGGDIESNGSLSFYANQGSYWTSVASSSSGAYSTYFDSNLAYYKVASDSLSKPTGRSIRCLVK